MLAVNVQKACSLPNNIIVTDDLPDDMFGE